MLHRRSILRVASFALIGALMLPIAVRSDEQIGHAQAVIAKNGMVVAQEAIAARIGADILQQGKPMQPFPQRLGIDRLLADPEG